MIYSGLILAEKASAFTQSVVGSTLIEQGKGLIANKVGMLVGAAFPEASVGFAAGTAAANRLVGESENKSKIVFGVGCVAALAATSLATGLNYLTGTQIEYGQALEYMVTAGGVIAGSITALQMAGQEISVDYIPRMAASMVVGDIVGGAITGAVDGTVGVFVHAATSDSLPGATMAAIGAVVSPVLSMTGSTVASTVAYFGPETAKVVDAIIHQDSPPIGNQYDPGVFIQKVATAAEGSTEAFSASMTSQLVDSPLISSLVQSLLQYTIDKKLPTNALVRAVNDYVQIIQQPSVQEKITAFKAAPTKENQDILKQEIARLVKATFSITERGIAKTIRTGSNLAVAPLVAQLVDLISTQEVALFSVNLSDKTQTQAILEALIPSLIPFIGVYAKRELASPQDLTDKDVGTFYQNITTIVLTPYSEYKIVQGAGRLISAALPIMQKRAQFIPQLLATTIGKSLASSADALGESGKPAKVKARSFWKSIEAKVPFLGLLLNALGVKKLFKILKNTFVSIFAKAAPVTIIDPSVSDIDGPAFEVVDDD